MGHLTEMSQLSEEQKRELLRPFTVEEVKEVVFEIENNKAPGPDGFQWTFISSGSWLKET